MWSPLLEPGRLILVHGQRGMMRAFHQELAHYAVHHEAGSVLWCDGEHGFNPYDFADLNLERGFDAEHGAERVLVKRCMTPFQWDTVLTKHLEQKLHSVEASLVLVTPYDALFSTDELKDWEQEDYVAYSLAHLRNLARRHSVPLVLSVDMARWWRSHPILAKLTLDGVDERWSVARSGDGWRAIHDRDGRVIEPQAVRQVTIWDYGERDKFARPIVRVATSTPKNHIL